MRFAALAVLSLVLISSTAFAALPWQSANPQQNAAAAPHNFGGANCAQKVPCPDSSSAASPENYVAYGNACITQSFGFNNADGFFEKYRGLDSRYCLTPKAGAIPKVTSNAVAPYCCITKAQDKSCFFRCDLVEAR